MNISETKKITLELTELEASLLSTALDRIRGYSIEYDYYNYGYESRYLRHRPSVPMLHHEDLKNFVTNMAQFNARYPPIPNLRFDR